MCMQMTRFRLGLSQAGWNDVIFFFFIRNGIVTQLLVTFMAGLGLPETVLTLRAEH